MPKWQLVRDEAHGCGGWTIVSAFLLGWAHRTFSVWHYWIDNWSVSTILGSFIFFSSLRCGSKENSSFWCEDTIICSSFSFLFFSFAWLQISDNMIGLQKFLPCKALVTFNYLWNGCAHPTSRCTWGAREQWVWPFFFSAAWRKFTWIKSSEKQDSMKVTWHLVQLLCYVLLNLDPRLLSLYK